jgi:beta-lactamase regulating signal transducer with metallopeptidase domain
MNPILQSAFLKALGWALLDSLWQMGVVWLLYLLVTRKGKNFTANQRHNFALCSLTAGSAWLLISFLINVFAGRPRLLSTTPFFLGAAQGRLEPLLPLISTGYLVVALCLIGRLYQQVAYTRKLSTEGLKRADPEIRVFLQRLAGEMGITKPVRVWISRLVETPLTVGFWKPVILLPVSIVNNLTLKQTESILLHELYHIQRNDFLMNLLIAVSDIILFFNPFARFFKDVIQREREHRCDDMVLQYRYDAGMYAQALLILEQQRPGKPVADAVSMAATGSNRFVLLARVKRLLTGETVPEPVSQRLAAFLFSALFLAYVGWQTPAVDMAAMLPSIVTGASTTVNESAIEASQSFATAVAPEIKPPSPDAGKLKAKKAPGSETNDGRPSGSESIESRLAEVIVSTRVEEMLTEAKTLAGITFVTTAQAPEYSLSISPETIAVPPVPGEPMHPFVPSSSFYYKITEDTALPEKSLESLRLSTPALVKSLSLIKDSDWIEIEQILRDKGQTLNLPKLQLELSKAVAEIDWKGITKELEDSGDQASDQIQKYREEAVNRYLRFQQEKAEKAGRQRLAAEEMLRERLHQKSPAAPKSPRKIVNI